jgi:hypothetical protein
LNYILFPEIAIINSNLNFTNYFPNSQIHFLN